MSAVKLGEVADLHRFSWWRWPGWKLAMWIIRLLTHWYNLIKICIIHLKFAATHIMHHQLIAVFVLCSCPSYYYLLRLIIILLWWWVETKRRCDARMKPSPIWKKEKSSSFSYLQDPSRIFWCPRVRVEHHFSYFLLHYLHTSRRQQTNKCAGCRDCTCFNFFWWVVLLMG